MRELAKMRKLDVWYARLDVDDMQEMFKAQLKGEQGKRFAKNVAKARSKDSMKAFNKLVRGRRRSPEAGGRSAPDRAPS